MEEHLRQYLSWRLLPGVLPRGLRKRGDAPGSRICDLKGSEAEDLLLWSRLAAAGHPAPVPEDAPLSTLKLHKQAIMQRIGSPISIS